MGHDADCNAATAGTIVGVRVGYKRIAALPGFQMPDVYQNVRSGKHLRSELPEQMKVSEQVELMLRLAERVILANGGQKIEIDGKTRLPHRAAGRDELGATCQEKVMKRTACWTAVAALMMWLTATGQVAMAEGGYCIVVSRSTYDDPQWKPVVDALIVKHQGTVITFETAVKDSLVDLQKELPRYVCFVAKPTEATREFVAEVNRLTRRIDDDPYTDAVWGILTGYDAACALRIARHKEPLVIRRVAAGTEVELRMCDEGVWYCELNQGKMVRKEPGMEPQQARSARRTPPRPSSMPSTTISPNSSSPPAMPPSGTGRSAFATATGSSAPLPGNSSGWTPRAIGFPSTPTTPRFTCRWATA